MIINQTKNTKATMFLVGFLLSLFIIIITIAITTSLHSKKCRFDFYPYFYIWVSYTIHHILKTPSLQPYTTKVIV